MQKLTEFLALRRNTTLLLVALVFAGTGERLWLGFAPKYLETLGAGVLIIGLFDALQTLLGAIYAYPGGWLTDHWGQRRSLLLFNALSLAGYLLADKHGQRPFVLATFVFFTLFPLSLLFANTFAWLAVAFVVRGLKEFGEPARKALIIAQAPPELRARTYGAYYLIRDGIVTTGSLLGAWLWSLSPQANF